MPPKKRDREIETQKAPQRLDQIQADHELFLQAFEKPTQIYRFLRNRNRVSPMFLNRNLTYMRQRQSRSNKSRKGFRIDSILEKAAKNRHAHLINGYLTLTFLGLYDKKIENTQEVAKVETLLLKICHKKRKDVSSPISQGENKQTNMGVSDVPINPSENEPPSEAPTISIHTASFSLNNNIGHNAKTYTLHLRVQCSPNSCYNSESDEPAQKKRKSSVGSTKSNGEELKLYGSELVVYDKHGRCMLSDGEYELNLQEVKGSSLRSSPKKHSSWEAVADPTEYRPFQTFSKGPSLKFRLNWSERPDPPLVQRPTPLPKRPHGDNKENRPGNTSLEHCTVNNSNNNTSNSNNHSNDNNSTSLPAAVSPATPSKESVKMELLAANTQQIVYQFLYNNNSRQQTEACEDLHCPWCYLDCGTLYSLLKHLKLCHARFTFTYVPISQGARIDVAINECYDGSYAGSPHELISQPSNSVYTRGGPTRRASVTNILVCKPKRTKPTLTEFLEIDENELENQRPYITGHNRLYHHTVTCLPIYPKEMDIDSEGENDPKWLQTKTMMMIDDFTDVNEGEKELMKMWNLHVMKQGYVGDCQIPLACQMFVENKGKELLMKNLYRNFVLHVCSLLDFGLISPVVVYQVIQKLQEIMKDEGENGDIRKVLEKSHEAQVKQWETVGMKTMTRELHSGKTCAKTNFNSDISQNSNARRKTVMSMCSPPNSQTIKSNSSSSNATKHASIINASSSNKAAVLQNGNGKASTLSNGVSRNGVNGDSLPGRRKSTTTTNSSAAASTVNNQNHNASSAATTSTPNNANGKRSLTASDAIALEYPKRRLLLEASDNSVKSQNTDNS